MKYRAWRKRKKLKKEKLGENKEYPDAKTQ
jgi:hypothetical protein